MWRNIEGVAECGDCGGMCRSMASVAIVAACGRVLQNMECVVECAIERRVWRSMAKCGRVWLIQEYGEIW